MASIYTSRFGFAIPKGPVISQTVSTTPHPVTDEDVYKRQAPIERATIEANNRTYKEVLSTAAEFSEVEGSDEKIAALTESGELEGLGYGSVAIESVLEGKDESGAVIGHVDVYKRQEQ